MGGNALVNRVMEIQYLAAIQSFDLSLESAFPWRPICLEGAGKCSG